MAGALPKVPKFLNSLMMFLAQIPPTKYIIDKQGKVYDRIVGPTSKDALMDYVSKLT